MKRVIIIAPHPDDETLGVGGTLLKHKKYGDEIFCIFVTKMDEKLGFSKERIEQRNNEISKVTSMYGFSNIYKLDYLTSTLSQNNLSSLINDISKIFNEIKPQIIYLPYKNDVHSDHRIIFEGAYACTKSFRHPYIETVLMYETVSETEFSSDYNFKPNYFVNIEKFFDKKIQILQIYSSEVQKSSMPRSIENVKALATFRGAMINKKYAESFEILKIINN